MNTNDNSFLFTREFLFSECAHTSSAKSSTPSLYSSLDHSVKYLRFSECFWTHKNSSLCFFGKLGEKNHVVFSTEKMPEEKHMCFLTVLCIVYGYSLFYYNFTICFCTEKTLWWFRKMVHLKPSSLREIRVFMKHSHWTMIVCWTKYGLK